MSARASSGSPVRWLRRLLLGLLLAMIAGLVGLYLLGRPRPIEEALEPDTAEEARGAERDVIAWSQGFEFEQKVGERTAFSLRGDRFATDREGITRLEGVDLELAREQETYRVRSRRATWNPEGREAHLAGEVRLEGGRGFWLESARLDLIGEGRTLVSRELVRFGSRRGVEGRANDLRFDVDEDRLLLRGRVRAASPASAEREAFSVESDQVVYNRAGGFLRAQGRVEVVSGSDRVRAHEVKVELDPSGERPRRVLAHGQVIGGIDPDLEDAPAAGEPEETTAATSEAGTAGVEASGEAVTEAGDEALAAEGDEAESAGRIRFKADLARVELGATDGGIRAIELEGGETDPARVLFRVDETTSRILRAPKISAQVAKGELSGAKAEGGVQIRERVVGAAGAAVQRTASAETAEAGFAETGDLARLELVGSVELTEPSFEARGERAVLEVASGSSRLEGGDRRAWARSARGELLAPEILHSREGGEIEARGGVHSTLFSGDGSAVRLGPGGGDDEKEPIRVESKTARWREQERSWEFRGDVRAAQGDRLLFAERLEGSEATGDMSAEGGVRTLWSEAGEEGGKKASTAVSAERLRYLAEPGRAEYEGGVKVRQLDRELDAARLVVELDEARQVRRMVATGGVTIVDRKSGRKVEGETADHDLVARTIVVEGSPVVLSESDGSKLRGPRLLYDVATGSARMIGSGETQ